MEPEARHTLIGAVVVALVLSLGFAILWLSHSGVASDFQNYTIKFERQSLEGLQVGADVNMRGIKIGRVEAFAIDRKDSGVVRVRVRIMRDTPVNVNTRAVVARNLLTGIARINLETWGLPGDPLVNVPAGETWPVIAEGTSDFEQITETANRLVIGAESVLGNLEGVFTPSNREALGQTMLALRDLSTGLASRLGELDTVAGSIDRSLQGFERSSEQLGLAAAAIAREVGPLAADAHDLLKTGSQALLALRGASEQANGALAEFGASSREIGEAAQRLSGDSLAEFERTARELRAAAAMLARTAEQFADPRTAILGPGPRQLGPGEAAR